LISLFRFGNLKLLANDSSYRQSCPSRHFLEPRQELIRKTLSSYIADLHPLSRGNF